VIVTCDLCTLGIRCDWPWSLEWREGQTTCSRMFYRLPDGAGRPCDLLLLLILCLLFPLLVLSGKEGPIHDVQWSPSGKEFVVVHGCECHLHTPPSFLKITNLQLSSARIQCASCFNHYPGNTALMTPGCECHLHTLPSVLHSLKTQSPLPSVREGRGERGTGERSVLPGSSFLQGLYASCVSCICMPCPFLFCSKHLLLYFFFFLFLFFRFLFQTCLPRQSSSTSSASHSLTLGRGRAISSDGTPTATVSLKTEKIRPALILCSSGNLVCTRCAGFPRNQEGNLATSKKYILSDTVRHYQGYRVCMHSAQSTFPFLLSFLRLPLLFLSLLWPSHLLAGFGNLPGDIVSHSHPTPLPICLDIGTVALNQFAYILFDPTETLTTLSNVHT